MVQKKRKEINMKTSEKVKVITAILREAIGPEAMHPINVKEMKGNTYPLQVYLPSIQFTLENSMILQEAIRSQIPDLIGAICCSASTYGSTCIALQLRPEDANIMQPCKPVEESHRYDAIEKACDVLFGKDNEYVRPAWGITSDENLKLRSLWVQNGCEVKIKKLKGEEGSLVSFHKTN